jgi:hypothetical protein
LETWTGGAKTLNDCLDSESIRLCSNYQGKPKVEQMLTDPSSGGRC